MTQIDHIAELTFTLRNDKTWVTSFIPY